MPIGQRSLSSGFDGELIGGCDIVCDMEASGELKELVSTGADEGDD
jgi:monothiol glutaredoxin